MKPHDLARFWSKVEKTNGGCWFWKGTVFSNGYGAFSIKKVHLVRVHRLSWIIANGKIPKGMCVCHECDNKLCVNPAHLCIGTHWENMADRQRKGRTRNGEKSSSPLTEKEVREIRKKYASGEAGSVLLGKAYGISPTAICNIINRTTWKHLPLEQDEVLHRHTPAGLLCNRIYPTMSELPSVSQDDFDSVESCIGANI